MKCYDDIPPEWGDIYDISLNSPVVPSFNEITFIPILSIWISILLIIVIFTVKRLRIRENTIVYHT